MDDADECECDGDGGDEGEHDSDVLFMPGGDVDCTLRSVGKVHAGDE